MAARQPHAPTTPIRVCMVQRVKGRMLTATGEAPSRCAVTSGRRPHIEQTHRVQRRAFVLPREREALVIVARMGTVASLPKGRTTICMPARTGMSTARIQVAAGKSMTTAAGRIRVPSQRLMLKMAAERRALRRSNVHKAQVAGRVLRNSQLLQEQCSSLTEMLRRAKQE